MESLNDLLVILKDCWNLIVVLFNTAIPDDTLAYIDTLMYSTLWYIRDIIDIIGYIPA